MYYKVEGSYIELYFDNIPSEKIRETMKICGWHWYSKKKCWSNKNTAENLIWAKKLSEELNPKERNPLLDLKKRVIGMKDVVVRNNGFYCGKHHEMEDVAGIVDVIYRDGRIATHMVPLVFCESNNTYYILEETYRDLQKKGIIRCEIYSEKAYKSRGTKEFGKLSEASPLRRWGYTVGQDADYTSEQRRAILEDLLDCGVLTRDQILSYLDFFIKLNHNGSDIALAKWKEDRDYIANYKLGSSKRVKINKIIVHAYREK